MGNPGVWSGLWPGFGVARPDSDRGIRAAGLAPVFGRVGMRKITQCDRGYFLLGHPGAF